MTNTPAVLVTDFDGTLTEQDVYRLVRDAYLPAGQPDPWEAYLSGETAHFDALAEIFALTAEQDEDDVRTLLDQVGLQPGLAGLVDRLHRAGWEVVVASAGCRWYIDALLASAGVDLEVHANPGTFVPGRGLVMQRPTTTPYPSEELGVDKAAIVRDARRRADRVAFAGDGYADLAAARLVDDALRFGRGDLARAAAEEGLAIRPFRSFDEVVDAVVGA